MTRKHRSQVGWQAIIQQQKDSGLSSIVFCQQQGMFSWRINWNIYYSGRSGRASE